METKKDASIYDIISIGLIRKKILQNIGSFSDISNLSQTCKWINFYIEKESLRRSMIWFKNYTSIYIKLKEKYENDRDNENLLSLENIEIKKIKKLYNELNDNQQDFGEIITINNRMNFRFVNGIRNLKENEYKFFVEKLIKDMNLNRDSCKNIKYLSLWSDWIDTDINLCIIGYLKHENISYIEIPYIWLVNDIIRFKEINHNIFEGFPRLTQLIINVSIPFIDNETILKSKDTIEYVMNNLSKIKNSSLILYQVTFGNSLILSYINMIYGIAKKYNINVKYKMECILEKGCKLIQFLQKSNYFSLGKIITSLCCSINNSFEFFNIIKNVQNFSNLEKFQIEFHFFDIKKDLENIDGINFNDLSFKHCKKLRNILITVDYYKLSQIDNLDKEKIIQNNLRYLVSLMPSTVEILKLENFTNLNKNLLELINICMPNIKLIESLYVSYKDCDSLKIFKNLQYLRCINKGFIQVPDTVKLFLIKQYECRCNENSKFENKKNIEEYSKKFTKSLKTGDEEYIFFNNIVFWENYKSMIQNYDWYDL